MDLSSADMPVFDYESIILSLELPGENDRLELVGSRIIW